MSRTRTPLRVTLGGGGTDLPSYYEKHGGFVFAMGIDKHVDVRVQAPTADGRVWVRYESVETVDRVSELSHELAREALFRHGFETAVEVTSSSELPAGTGLGSSGAYLVGLLTALRDLRGEATSAAAVAEDACRIELEVLKKGIGKQDQYMAAHGGLTVLEIEPTGVVAVRRVELSAGAAAELVANTHMYYTGRRRRAEEVLRDQDAALRAPAEVRNGAESALHRIKQLGLRILAAVEAEDFDAWGRLLHEHWESKKRLSRRITLDRVDDVYARARSEYGVLGGKLVGAGGGGFLMLYAPARHEELERFMATQGMPRLRYGIADSGARVLDAVHA